MRIAVRAKIHRVQIRAATGTEKCSRKPGPPLDPVPGSILNAALHAQYITQNVCLNHEIRQFIVKTGNSTNFYVVFSGTGTRFRSREQVIPVHTVPVAALVKIQLCAFPGVLSCRLDVGKLSCRYQQQATTVMCVTSLLREK